MTGIVIPLECMWGLIGEIPTILWPRIRGWFSMLIPIIMLLKNTTERNVSSSFSSQIAVLLLLETSALLEICWVLMLILRNSRKILWKYTRPSCTTLERLDCKFWMGVWCLIWKDKLSGLRLIRIVWEWSPSRKSKTMTRTSGGMADHLKNNK